MKQFWLILLLTLLPTISFAMPAMEDIEREIKSPEFSRALDMTEDGGFFYAWETDIKASFFESVEKQKKSFCLMFSGILLYAVLLALSGHHPGAVFMGRLALSAACLEHAAEQIRAAVLAVREIAGLVQVLLPSLCVLTAASGGTFRAASGGTVGLICGEIGAAVIAGWVIPLTVFSFVTGVFHGVGEISLQGVARFFSSLSKWLLGLVLSLSVGALAISGFASGVKDSMAMKTAKFLTGTLVPIAGAALSQATESVAVSANLLRGTVGTAGLVAVVLYLLKPVARLLVAMLFYRLLSAIADVLCGDKQALVFTSAADTFGMLIGSVAAMGVMAFFAVSILLGGVG